MSGQTKTVKIGLDNWEVATLNDEDQVVGTPVLAQVLV